MGDKIFHLLKQPVVRIVLLIAVLSVVGGAGWGLHQSQQVPPQPLEFPHNLHIGLGIQCLYCHPGAWTGPSAGLPTISKCWACHQQLKKYADGTVPFPPSLEILKDHVERDEAIPWVPVAIMPDFVYFSHRPHIAAGLNCEDCHGDMSKLTVAENPQVMNMGWCLDCHRERAAADQVKLIKLLDCATCHK
jgi:hypothetical protein